MPAAGLKNIHGSLESWASPPQLIRHACPTQKLHEWDFGKLYASLHSLLRSRRRRAKSRIGRSCIDANHSLSTMTAALPTARRECHHGCIRPISLSGGLPCRLYIGPLPMVMLCFCETDLRSKQAWWLHFKRATMHCMAASSMPARVISSHNLAHGSCLTIHQATSTDQESCTY